MVSHPCNPSPRETEAGGSEVPEELGLHSAALSPFHPQQCPGLVLEIRRRGNEVSLPSGKSLRREISSN